MRILHTDKIRLRMFAYQSGTDSISHDVCCQQTARSQYQAFCNRSYVIRRDKGWIEMGAR